MKALPPAFLLILSLFFAPPQAAGASTGETCRRALTNIREFRLSPTSGYTFEQWQDAYKAARERNSLLAGAFALTHMVIERGREQGLSLRSLAALRAYARVLERPAVGAFVFNEAKSADIWAVHERRQNSLAQPYSTAQRIARVTATSGVHYLWGLGPFLLRLIPHWFQLHSVKKLVQEIHEHLFSRSDLQGIFGIENDKFLQSIEAQYFQDEKQLRTAIRAHRKNLIAIPLAVSMLGIFNPINLYAMSSHTIYPNAEFIADTQTASHTPFAGRNVVFISERSLISDALGAPGLVRDLTGEVDVAHVRNIQNIQSQAASFRSHVVGSIAELNAALESSRDTDVVIIMAHGKPGTFAIGPDQTLINEHIEELSPHVLRDGAVLIYLSCGFGDRRASWTVAERDETWVAIARRIMGRSGYAIASTNAISFGLEIPAKYEGAQNDRLRVQVMTLASGVISLIRDATTAPFGTISVILDDADRVYVDSEQPGLRIYDVAMDSVTYMPHAEAQ